MGEFKKKHKEVMDAFPDMWREEVARIKTEFPHITTEAAKIVALDVAVPQFMMYAMKVMEPKQQESTKETKNVKVRRKKEQSNDAKNQLKFTDIT